MGLADYKELVGSAAGFCTVAQIFAPVFICKDIVKQGNTENVTPSPFIGGLGMSLVVLKYGHILNDATITSVNLFGFVLNILYLSLFYYYTNEREQLLKNTIKILLGVGAIYGYTVAEFSPTRLEFNYGIIITVLMLFHIATPLLDLKTIIANKDTGSLPFPMIFSGAVVTFLWLLYGIIIENAFIQFQNVIAFSLLAFQLLLFLIYPPQYKAEKETKKKI
ncbi:sugar transporter SWEET1 [Cimex lectularius]|uniref:Sugar transporter SWEET n=1 Tax=Cimex lectularius TaxID=79782 RepID=A0A8I6RXB8_CIMLE|nr:sugar transporter SWEET1 [Cimex lectularius]XP_014254170.1 sugar transporter SWEET1 [Cimex lectularius]